MQARVLLALADPTVLKHLSHLLAGRGYECRCAPTLSAAIAELRAAPCQAAVLDLDLLGADLAASARRLREADPAARLIALDSLAERRRPDEAATAFDAVIPKPFLLEPLLDTLAPGPRPRGAAPGSPLA